MGTRHTSNNCWVDIEYQTWRDEFLAAGERLADRGHPFTSEDIVAVVGLPTGEVGQNKNNAIGSLMGALARRKVVVKTGRTVTASRAASHNARLSQWVGAQWADRYAPPSKDAQISIMQRIDGVRLLHSPVNPLSGPCKECGKPYPCPTARLVGKPR